MTGDFCPGRNATSSKVVPTSPPRSPGRDTSYMARYCVVAKKKGPTFADVVRLSTTCVRLSFTFPEMFTTLPPTFSDLVGRTKFSKCFENFARLGRLGYGRQRRGRCGVDLVRFWQRCEPMRLVHTPHTGRDTKSRKCKLYFRLLPRCVRPVVRRARLVRLHITTW